MYFKVEELKALSRAPVIEMEWATGQYYNFKNLDSVFDMKMECLWLGYPY